MGFGRLCTRYWFPVLRRIGSNNDRGATLKLKILYYNKGWISTSYMKLNNKHEAGIVSIMVTMVMLIVISLIVLGFAEISRTEQRNTTDAQLSVSAYYGAESGINDALAVISAYYPPGQQIPVKPDCNVDNNLADPYHWLNGIVNNNDKVSYTCLTVNPTPITLT